MGSVVLDAVKATVDKVGTAVLNTTAQTLCAAVNELLSGLTTVSDNLTALSNSLGTAATKDVPESGDAAETQIVLGSDTRLTDSRNAADVYPWAKASTKPTYAYSEITGKPSPSIVVQKFQATSISSASVSGSMTSVGNFTNLTKSGYTPILIVLADSPGCEAVLVPSGIVTNNANSALTVKGVPSKMYAYVVFKRDL